jgi:uncharacterized DUF497 family protein
VDRRLEFEWDANKARKNARFHGVTFEEARSVFADPLAVFLEDELHSEDEVRSLLIGHSSEARLLFIAFTDRDSRIRIISAREATRRERRQYEEEAR